MSPVRLSEVVEGRAALEGVLDFSSVPEIWPQLERLIERESALELSLAGVSSSNSAALALLLEAQQKAHAAAHRLQLIDVPRDLADLAGLSNLEELLGVSPQTG